MQKRIEDLFYVSQLDTFVMGHASPLQQAKLLFLPNALAMVCPQDAFLLLPTQERARVPAGTEEGEGLSVDQGTG